jgi:hypothetical protein
VEPSERQHRNGERKRRNRRYQKNDAGQSSAFEWIVRWVLGGVVVLAVVLWKTRGSKRTRIRLPTRSFVTLLPPDVNVSGSLPYFVSSYGTLK